MRWSPQGAHLFLQVRTRVLNDDLAADFARWYPGFSHQKETVETAAVESLTLLGGLAARTGQAGSLLLAATGRKSLPAGFTVL